ncbi:efflux RND transporter periplasmic adaptor subunit [uncultured Nonlabens sp.]|uniref:efflux RND transporter periplasmic adaptor subunit n=1 Tax=uncultured Nonlabens sp. TaxID=859306 RepID=UPI00262F2F97|nr:efflux RND transporter periplasmic adaptor subunit [uncultured Nonlabens sp.]
MNKTLGFIIVLLILAGAAFIITNDNGKNIPTEKPKLRNISKTDFYIGNFKPSEIVKIASEIPGVVDTIYVKNNQKVEIGSPIAKVKIIQNPNIIQDAKRSVQITRADLNQKKIDHGRNEQLFSKGVIARQAFEITQLALDMSRIEYQTAINNLEIARNGYVKKSKNAPNFIISKTQGRVLQVLVKNGKQVTERNTFNDGTTIAIIIDDSSYYFYFTVSELDINKLEVGSDFKIVIKALDNSVIKAQIEEIIPVIKPDELVDYNVKAIVLDSISGIRPGFTGLAEFETASVKKSLSIKEKNIIYRRRKSYVELVDKQQSIKEIEIETGMSDGIFTEIKTGLKLTDKIKIQ